MSSENKKYLIYIDILGFEHLPRKIAEETQVKEDVARETFLTLPLRNKINEIKDNIVKRSKGVSEIEGSDNYILLVDDINTVFEIISNITTMPIPIDNYGFIPLEVAVGTKRIDEGYGVELINRSEVISFLKADLVTPYRKYYKEKKGEPIRSSFVVISSGVLSNLEPYDEYACKLIDYGKTYLYEVNLEHVHKRCNVRKFLALISHQDSEKYARIDELFIPPQEYDDIKKTLKENKIVFITGTPEYGKTYTAVRLLWEYYLNGYNPVWFVGSEESDRKIARTKLEEIESVLKPGSIIYFEDPFGKTMYEKRETLEREIDTIIESVKNCRDVHVVITSREEVYKEFESEQLSSTKLEEFERKLNIKKPSYLLEDRFAMLRSWARSKSCVWLIDNYLPDAIFEYMEDNYLLTPLSIWSFVKATIKCTDEEELFRLLEEKTQGTSESFAKEINSMSEDKVVFLSLLCIEGLHVDYAHELYDQLIQEVDIKNSSHFSNVLDWFKNDKIELFKRKYIKFSHPSYSEAFSHVLSNNGVPTAISRNIFSKTLIKLSQSPDLIEDVSGIIENLFDALEKDTVNEVLINLSYLDTDELDNHILTEALSNLLWCIKNKSEKLSMLTISRLLVPLSEHYSSAGDAVDIVKEKFKKIHEDELALILCNLTTQSVGHEAYEVAEVIKENLAQISDELLAETLNNLLTESHDDDTLTLTANIIRDNFRRIPPSSKVSLLNSFFTAWSDKAFYILAQILEENFFTMPIGKTCDLVVKAIDYVHCEELIVFVVNNINRIPEKERNQLMIDLAKTEVGYGACLLIKESYGEEFLPDKVKNILPYD